MNFFCQLQLSDFWRCCAEISVGGLIGGVLYWISALLAEKDVPSQSKKIPDVGGIVPADSSIPASAGLEGKVYAPWNAFANAFVGFGGAWAVCLVMLWAKRMPYERLLLDELELLATSIVAGYAGNKILPMVAERLTKELLEKSTKEAQRAATEATAAAREVNDATLATKYASLISEVLAYLDSSGNQTIHQTADYISRLQQTLLECPTFRKGAVLLARLFAELQKDNLQAIRALQIFIAAKANAGEKDQNVADVSWNIANYSEFEFRRGGGADRSLRTAAIDALEESIRIVPGYKADYLSDDDFAELRKDPEAQKRLGKS